MERTLVAMFDDRDSAQRARARLIAEGHAESGITLREPTASDAAATSASSTTSGSAHATQDDGGGIGGWFRSLFGLQDEDDDVRMHSEAARRGATMLSVNVADDDSAEHVGDVLQECGAVDLDSRAAVWRNEGWSGAGAGTALTGTAAAVTTTGTTQASTLDVPKATVDTAATDRTIPVVEEQLAVGKRSVQRGGVRVYTRVVERPVEESIHLREEHAEIQRRRVDRPATEADLAAAMKEGTIELRETAEEAVVSKTAHVVEEIDVGTRVDERVETVRDTVRRTEVDIDKVDASRTEREHALAARDAVRTPDTSGGSMRDAGTGATTRDAGLGTGGGTRDGGTTPGGRRDV